MKHRAYTYYPNLWIPDREFRHSIPFPPHWGPKETWEDESSDFVAARNLVRALQFGTWDAPLKDGASYQDVLIDLHCKDKNIAGLKSEIQKGFFKKDFVMWALESDQGGDLYLTDAHTALHTAARSGSPEACRVLIAAGWNANMRNEAGQTPVFVAAHCGHTGVCEVMLQTSSANALVPDNEGTLPVSAAVAMGHIDTAEYLLRSTPTQSLCWVDNLLGTPLHYAHFFGRDRIVALLDGICGSIRNGRNVLPITYGFLNGHVPVEKLEPWLFEETLEFVRSTSAREICFVGPHDPNLDDPDNPTVPL